MARFPRFPVPSGSLLARCLGLVTAAALALAVPACTAPPGGGQQSGGGGGGGMSY